MKKIFTILVAYNPKENELVNAIERLKKQTDIVVVCNNSNYDVEFEDEKVKVFNFRDNLGIAKAQSIGMKWAFDNGAEFILQMDQDSEADDKLVENLVKCYDELTDKGYDIGLVGPQDYDKETQKINKGRISKGTYIEDTNYVFMNQTLSSGSLIPKKTYKKIGGMEDDLFIDAVDEEYCWRIIEANMKVVKNNDALLAHKIGEGEQNIIGSINLVISSPIRYYYQFRNVLLLSTRSYAPVYWRVSMLVKVGLKLVVFPFRVKDGRKIFGYMIKGIKDGLLRRYGRIDSSATKKNLRKTEKNYEYYMKKGK
ncbi:glycosyltransferase family 2 protein [bacterium]|mgnify:FL=1|jgi:rhamnosyltransferase|nr:glycosyltransferase family 2 protein [bacterium]